MQKDPGSYSGILNYGLFTINLSAVINPIPSITVEDIEVKVNSTPVENAIDFGSLNYRQSVIKTLVVKNVSEQARELMVTLNDQIYTKIYDNCSTGELKPGTSCQIKLFISGLGKSGTVDGGIQIGPRNLDLTANIQGQQESQSVNSQLALIYDNQSFALGQLLDLGTINLDTKKTLSLFLKNIGTDSSLLKTLAVENADIILNNCQAVSLKPNQSCRLQIKVPTSNKGVKSIKITEISEPVGSNLSLDYIVRSPGDTIDCTSQLANAELGLITWNCTSYSNCQIQSCKTNYHNENNSCTVDTIACQTATGSGTQTWNGTSFEPCQVNSCIAGYHKTNNQCDSDEVVCSIDNATLALEIWNGTQYSECQVQSCMANYHKELNTCANNTQTCLVSNGSGTKIWNGSSYDSCIANSCESGYYVSSGNCSLIQYVPTYSTYSPLIPTNQLACDGTVTSNRSIILCKQQHNNLTVANSLCSDANSTVITQSPAGSKIVSIANGTETYSCLMGSTTQNFVSRSCEPLYYNSGSGCSLIQYVPTFSSYAPAIPSSQVACDGTVNSTRSITLCRQQHDNAVVSNSLCVDSAPLVTTQSPAGTKIVNISNGTETYSCPIGSTTQTFVSRSCGAGYYNNGTSCALIQYVPTYSAYSPAIPSNQVACDGTVVSTRSISLCKQQHDNLVVSNSFCSDSTPSVTTQSPAGNKVINISNGTETYSCPIGSTTQTFISRSCGAGYYNNGTSCALIQYTATYSAYNPIIPTNLVACDGTVTSNRTITSCKQTHDNTVVANSFCTDASATVNTQSPAGNKNVTITSGFETYSCPMGSTTQTFVSRTCDSGYFNNGSACQETILNNWGNASDGSLSTASSTNLCDNTTDGDVCVKQYQILTVNAGHVLTTAVRRKGLVIYVKGDLVVNGEISMTARGASVNPITAGVPVSGLDFYRFKTGGSASGSSVLTGAGSSIISVESSQAAVSNGVRINIPRLGAGPLPRASSLHQGYLPVDGVNGQTGAGGGGWLYSNGGSNNSGGPGGIGSCFSGGSGGGGNFNNTGSNINCAAGADYGGAGGNGCGDHPWGSGGAGAGNPIGTHRTGSTGTVVAAQTGTGGLLIIFVKGNVTIGSSGKITANGSNGGYFTNGSPAFGGGGSGGGSIVLGYAGTLTNQGSVTAEGGKINLTDTTYRAGNGSTQIIQISK